MAAIAVETGLPPSELLSDTWMLRAIVAYMQDRAKKSEKGRKR
ncbi:MAG TPA: hypothetical protein VIG24_10100 [Acidimicrobiia bacterium]